MTLARGDVIVGVDTHKDQHAGVSLDGLGGRLDQLFVTATLDGYEQLLDWARSQGRVVAFGVEGTGSYGIGLARFLRRHGVKVFEVSRPARKGERRLQGKSDTVDAEHAARQVLAGQAIATPKTADGDVEVLRLIKIARDTAVKAHSQAMITLKATLVTAADTLRAELEPLTDFKLISVCATFEVAGDITDPDRAMRHVLGSRARRWLQLYEEIKIHTRHLDSAPGSLRHNWLKPSGSVSTPPPSSSSPPMITPVVSAPRQHSPSCAARVRFPPPRARPTGID